MDNLTFYHGTSSLFLDGIHKHGLGYCRSILDEYKSIELAKDILPLCEELIEHDGMLMHVDALKFMVNQTRNFQHGKLFLSTSMAKAMSYAHGNKYGSEILSKSLLLLEYLLSIKLSDDVVKYLKGDLYQKYREAYSLLDRRPFPVLLEVNSVNANELLGLDGTDFTDEIFGLNDFFIDSFKSIIGEQKQTYAHLQDYMVKNGVIYHNYKAFAIDAKRTSLMPPAFEYQLIEINQDNVISGVTVAGRY